ncbi:hypothetical protein E2C01_049423 [Portunus trituberculatus]|uniref:Uncharacterized protein n=1 Tax=Portunus trituberculatus TaxID=210409 RepID=A0A5B7GDN9_PORTR|nr:hypothetical protein [Portunus trituberculatus]
MEADQRRGVMPRPTPPRISGAPRVKGARGEAGSGSRRNTLANTLGVETLGGGATRGVKEGERKKGCVRDCHPRRHSVTLSPRHR